uniref:Uncharacterized protein n=1 Tax=Rhizophora mucronata TaxID=61149 RepID=A0A2P2QAI9_RHIMU
MSTEPYWEFKIVRFTHGVVCTSLVESERRLCISWSVPLFSFVGSSNQVG